MIIYSQKGKVHKMYDVCTMVNKMTLREFIKLDCSSYSDRYEIYTGNNLNAEWEGSINEIDVTSELMDKHVYSFGLSAVHRNLIRVWVY